MMATCPTSTDTQAHTCTQAHTRSQRHSDKCSGGERSTVKRKRLCSRRFIRSRALLTSYCSTTSSSDYRFRIDVAVVVVASPSTFVPFILYTHTHIHAHACTYAQRLTQRASESDGVWRMHICMRFVVWVFWLWGAARQHQHQHQQQKRLRVAALLASDLNLAFGLQLRKDFFTLFSLTHRNKLTHIQEPQCVLHAKTVLQIYHNFFNLLESPFPHNYEKFENIAACCCFPGCVGGWVSGCVECSCEKKLPKCESKTMIRTLDNKTAAAAASVERWMGLLLCTTIQQRRQQRLRLRQHQQRQPLVGVVGVC